MLSLSIRALAIRPVLFSKPAVLQTTSYVTTRRSREVAKSQEFTRDDTDVASNISNSMDQITNILDNVAMSGAPQSNSFKGE